MSAGSPHPYDGTLPPSRQTARASRRSLIVWILAIVGGVGLVVVMLCCGLGFWCINLLGDTMAEEISAQVADDPVLQEHLGVLEETKFDLWASLQEDGEASYVYQVRGTNGAGTLFVKQITNEDGDEEVLSARLQLPTGQSVDLVQ